MLVSHAFGDLEIGANVAMVALAFVSTLAYYLCWRWCETSQVRKMAKGGRPGASVLPSPVPLLPRWIPFIGGHTLQMKIDKMHLQHELWAHTFGGDFELAICGKRVVFVTGVEDTRRMLHLRPAKMLRGWFPNQLPRMSEIAGLNPSLFFDEGKEWGRARRCISPALSGHQNVAGMIPAMTKIAERVCTKLSDQQGEIVDVVPTFDRFTHDVIALAGFGIDADSVRSTEDRPCVSFQAMGTLGEALMTLFVNPLVMLGWTIAPSLLPLARATKESSTRLSRVVQEAIDLARQQMKEGGETTPSDHSGGALLRKLVSVRSKTSAKTIKDPNNRKTFTDKEIVTQVKTLFLAGSESSAKTLSWALYYLAKHPKMLLRCRKEALRVAPLSGGMVSSFEQASQLLFCSVMFKEALRLRAPVPELPHYLAHGSFTMESGLEFKAGTAFSSLLRYPCLSEDAFTRATDFVPERWIVAEREKALLGEASAGGGDCGRKAVHREEASQFFGVGPRKCPGMHLANLEAAILLGAICARFDVALAPGQADPPEEVMKAVMGPTSLKVVFTLRKA